MDDSRITIKNKIGIRGGLHARLKSQEMLKEQVPQVDVKDFPNRLVIAADFSGSMDSFAAQGVSKSKLQLLSEAVQDFAMRADVTNTAIAVQSFPPGHEIPMTNDNQEVMLRMYGVHSIGDTPMGLGLNMARTQYNPTRVMLISDGEQTDGTKCFDEAKIYHERELICDCVHIGDSTSGEDTLKKIAEMTGGMYLKFKDTTTFAASFHYLLPEARAAIAGMLPSSRAELLGADESK